MVKYMIIVLPQSFPRLQPYSHRVPLGFCYLKIKCLSFLLFFSIKVESLTLWPKLFLNP